MDFMTPIQNPVYYCTFRYIQAYYSCPIKTYSAILWHIQNPVNSCIFRTLPYLKSWYIQHLRYIQNSVKEYSDIFRTVCNAHILRTLSYSKFCHIQSCGIFSIGGLFKILYIQAHSGILDIFDNDSYNNYNSITFLLFFTLILHTFQRNLKTYVF